MTILYRQFHLVDRPDELPQADDFSPSDTVSHFAGKNTGKMLVKLSSH